MSNNLDYLFNSKINSRKEELLNFNKNKDINFIDDISRNYINTKEHYNENNENNNNFDIDSFLKNNNETFLSNTIDDINQTNLKDFKINDNVNSNVNFNFKKRPLNMNYTDSSNDQYKIINDKNIKEHDRFNPFKNIKYKNKINKSNISIEEYEIKKLKDLGIIN